MITVIESGKFSESESYLFYKNGDNVTHLVVRKGVEFKVYECGYDNSAEIEVSSFAREHIRIALSGI